MAIHPIKRMSTHKPKKRKKKKKKVKTKGR